MRNLHDKEFIILLHGLGRTKNAMHKMQTHLLQQGYSVWNKSYPSRQYSIEELVDIAVQPAIEFAQKQGAQKIHLVGHSLGGILFRYYLQNHAVPELGNVVFIASPHKGSEVADKLMRISFISRIMGPVLSQLGTSEQSIPNQIQVIKANVGCIAGTRSSDPLFSFLMIPGPDDGKVSVESARLAEMSDFITVKRGHTFIADGDDTIFQVQYFIENGCFNHALAQSIA